MKRVLTLFLISLCCTSVTIITAAQNRQSGSEYDRREADIIAARLYNAILGRDGDGTGPRDAAFQIMGGHLDTQVEAMFNSPEFRQKSSRMSAADILDQIYQGLLDRRTDDGGVRTYLRDIEQRHYAAVVVRIIGSTEFDTKMLGRPDRADRRGNGRPMYSNEVRAMRAAEECQTEVLEQVRIDVSGPVLLRFETMDVSSAGWGTNSIRGFAIDMLDQNRRLSYRCDVERDRFGPSRVTYNYEGGRSRRTQTSRNARDFSLPSVRSCQDAVQIEIGRERDRRDVAFDSAGLAEWSGGLERVFGRGGELGTRFMFEYRCDVERGRVTVADFQPIR